MLPSTSSVCNAVITFQAHSIVNVTPAKSNTRTALLRCATQKQDPNALILYPMASKDGPVSETRQARLGASQAGTLAGRETRCANG